MASLTNLLPEINLSPKGKPQNVTVASNYEGADILVAAACYLYFVSAAVLLLRKNNSEFVEFHARQAFLILLIALLCFLFAPKPFNWVLDVAVLGLAIYCAVRAWQGKRWSVPYLGRMVSYIRI